MSKNISKIMKKVKSRDTQPELLFRKALWKEGVRYRVCPKEFPGKPDIVVSSKKVAVFIDGEFWHGGQWIRRKLDCLEAQFGNTESRNYWLPKIRMNMHRDCVSTAALVARGWTVLRFWESQVRKNLHACIGMTIDAIHGRSSPSPMSLAPQKTFYEFFAGIGLMRMALERQGWTASGANDNDPKKFRMYTAQFEGTEQMFNLMDIHNLRAKNIPSCALATASFPCNDLSLAGSREGLDGKSSSTFWGFLRLLQEMKSRRPPLILIENVMGFMTSRNGMDLKDALNGLNELGYSVDIFMVDASWFIPQSRKRLFIFGQIKDSVSLEALPVAQTVRENLYRPRIVVDFIKKQSQVRWLTSELPNPPMSERNLEHFLEDLPEEAPEWWSPARTQYLLSQIAPRQRAMLDSMIARPYWTYRTAFRRTRNQVTVAEVRADGIAGCLRTPRGGSARQILVKVGMGKFYARLLTPRECAKLMGASDYKIAVSPSQALMGFGDAVCVPVIEWIALHRLNPVVSELIRGRPLRNGEAN